MRDVYKDEEIGLANHFEQEAKANGPTTKGERFSPCPG